MDAAADRNVEYLRLLLAHGGDPNARDDDSPWSALRIAFSLGLQYDDWTSYYILLDAGADINADGPGGTIAEFAAHLNQWDKVAELLERGYHHDLSSLRRSVQGVEEVAMPPGQYDAALQVRTLLAQQDVH